MKVRSGFKLVIFEFGNVLVNPSLRMQCAEFNDTTSAFALKSDGLRHVFA